MTPFLPSFVTRDYVVVFFVPLFLVASVITAVTGRVAYKWLIGLSVAWMLLSIVLYPLAAMGRAFDPWGPSALQLESVRIFGGLVVLWATPFTWIGLFLAWRAIRGNRYGRGFDVIDDSQRGSNENDIS